LVQPKVREKETLTPEFWEPIFKDTDFKTYLIEKYQIGAKQANAKILAETNSVQEDENEL
jgi:hypothetical protein